MDSGAVSRTVTPISVYLPPSASGSGQTELQAPQSVTPVEDTQATTQPTARRLASDPRGAHESGFKLDPQTQSVVFEVADRQSGEVVFQLPSDDALRLKAYQEQQERVKSERTAAEAPGRPIEA